MSALTPIERSVRKARRRLFLQLLVNRLAVCWSVALALGLAWVVAQPILVESPPDWLWWAVVGGLVGVGTVLAVVWAAMATPSARTAALEVDTRFGLRERVTTALGLTPQEQCTPAGQAVLADAAAKVAPIAVGEKFPVRPRWHSAFVPALAGCIALAVMFPNTIANQLRAEGEGKPDAKKADALAEAKAQPKNPTPYTQRNKPPELAARRDKSKELKDLEDQLNQMMQKFDTDPNRETPEKLKEKVAELTSMEEKVKKFNEEKFERLARMEQQLRQLDRLNKDEDFQKGPAKDLNDALSKGDLKKAQDELDELKKKVKDKKLSPEEQEQLARQLDKMKDQMKQLARNKEREQQLQEMINKAKQEGKDAEALERELEKVKQDSKQCAECAQQLADKFQKAQEALKKGDFEEAARELEKAGQSLQDIEGELKDLEDAEQYLQRLKGEREGACKACQGEKPEGDPQRKDYADGQGVASGLRPENKDAKTASEDQRVRGLFDPKGKKTYGGGTKGPAFKKATTAELGPAIQTAAQEAPKAVDSGRYSRDAKDSVKEYFQNLGGQAPGGNK
jgi:uncharacterized coiled-coil DUF342 family protein